MTQRSFTSMLKSVEQDLDKVKTVFLNKVAEDLVRLSPVDTGTYVSNHSITKSSGSGGRKNSHGKPKDDGSAKGDALNKLQSDIASLSPTDTVCYIGNRSPYANRVEYSGWGSTPPYAVFTQTRALAPERLREAVQEVRSQQ